MPRTSAHAMRRWAARTRPSPPMRAARREPSAPDRSRCWMHGTSDSPRHVFLCVRVARPPSAWSRFRSPDFGQRHRASSTTDTAHNHRRRQSIRAMSFRFDAVERGAHATSSAASAPFRHGRRQRAQPPFCRRSGLSYSPSVSGAVSSCERCRAPPRDMSRDRERSLVDDASLPAVTARSINRSNAEASLLDESQINLGGGRAIPQLPEVVGPVGLRCRPAGPRRASPSATRTSRLPTARKHRHAVGRALLRKAFVTMCSVKSACDERICRCRFVLSRTVFRFACRACAADRTPFFVETITRAAIARIVRVDCSHAIPVTQIEI